MNNSIKDLVFFLKRLRVRGHELVILKTGVSKKTNGEGGHQLNKRGQELVILNMTLYNKEKAHYNMKCRCNFPNEM